MDVFTAAHQAVDELLKLANSSRRDSVAIREADNKVRACLEAIKREMEMLDTARHREQQNAIRSDALSRTIAGERNDAYERAESAEAQAKMLRVELSRHFVVSSTARALCSDEAKIGDLRDTIDSIDGATPEQRLKTLPERLS